MTGLDKLSLLTALGSVFLVVGAGATSSAAPITPVRFNSAYETQANRWHQEQSTRFQQQYNLEGPTSQRWSTNRF